jgi:hypothetical protein
MLTALESGLVKRSDFDTSKARVEKLLQAANKYEVTDLGKETFIRHKELADKLKQNTAWCKSEAGYIPEGF